MPSRKKSSRAHRPPKGAKPGARVSPVLRRLSGRIPGPAKLQAIYAQLMAYPNVVGCFLGWKHTRKRSTQKPAIICCVTTKMPRSALRPAEHLPRQIEWQKTSTSRGRLPVDVEVISGRIQYAACCGPGDAITGYTTPGMPAVREQGTIGLAMQHPEYGRVVTTAGHVFDIQGTTSGTVTYPEGSRPVVSLWNADGTNTGFRFFGEALKVVLTRSADYAVVLPRPPMSAENLYHDSVVIAAPYLPGPDDLGMDLYVLTAAGSKKTKFVGLSGTIPVGHEIMDGLLLTQFSTEGGDSGCCLVDETGKLWGLLVGYTTLRGTIYSAFMSATVPLNNEKATYL
jgi:hypothetical protein